MLTLQDIRFWAVSERAQGRTIVATNGCFDLFHAGHADFLRKAHMLGDNLVVGLNSDHSVTSLKGKDRPIVGLLDRARVLESLRFVSQVVPFSGKTAKKFLAAVRPDIWVKGGDWNLDTLDEGEKKVVSQSGGVIKFIHLRPDISTSMIVERIRG